MFLLYIQSYLAGKIKTPSNCGCSSRVQKFTRFHLDFHSRSLNAGNDGVVTRHGSGLVFTFGSRKDNFSYYVLSLGAFHWLLVPSQPIQLLFMMILYHYFTSLSRTYPRVFNEIADTLHLPRPYAMIKVKEVPL